MARKLPKRALSVAPEAVDRDDPALAEARSRHEGGEGSGGAWARAGAHATLGELQKIQDQRTDHVLSGDLVITLDPSQITDDIGSDRSTDWTKDEAFGLLKASLETNGQDVPIQVVAVDPDWRPVFGPDGVAQAQDARFHVISGRRRLEALRQLGQPVRAICVTLTRDGRDFDQLHRRYRENVERENLSLFDELLAIGEMFSHEKTFGEKMTGRSLAKRLGVAESKVSKGRAIFDNRERLAAEVENPHDLSLHELDALIPALRSGAPLPGGGQAVSAPKAAPTAPPIKRTQIIKGRKIVAKARKGRITLDMGADAKVDEFFLDRLLLFIQAEQGK